MLQNAHKGSKNNLNIEGQQMELVFNMQTCSINGQKWGSSKCGTTFLQLYFQFLILISGGPCSCYRRKLSLLLSGLPLAGFQKGCVWWRCDRKMKQNSPKNRANFSFTSTSMISNCFLVHLFCQKGYFSLSTRFQKPLGNGSSGCRV